MEEREKNEEVNLSGISKKQEEPPGVYQQWIMIAEKEEIRSYGKL